MTESPGSWGNPSEEQSQSSQPVNTPHRIDLGRRVVALMIDIAAAYFIGIVVSMVPVINNFLSMSITMVAFLLSRDYLFEGRGIGKNLMGLMVVDATTNHPANIMQSIERNLVVFAPFAALQLAGLMLRFIPIPWVNQAIVDLINLIGTIYYLIVIPLEAYRIHNRPDGLRIGDEIAGTKIIEAAMSFKNILPPQGLKR